MSFERIAGHEANLAALRKNIEGGKIPHALLLTGPKGVGKRLVALEFARALLCEAPVRGAACEKCSHCAKTARGTHPDFAVTEPNDKSNIVIGDIRQILAKISLRPFEARCQVLVIDDADGMNEESQNALLKSLEEPPDNVYFILVSSDLSRLLATVVSRCQRIAFDFLSESDLEKAVAAQPGVEGPRVRELARLLRGSLERLPVLLDLDTREAEDRIFGSIRSAKSRSVAAMPDRAKTAKAESLFEIDTLADVFRDLLVLKVTGETGRLFYQDRLADLQAAAAKFSQEEIEDILDAAGEAREKIQHNVNSRLVFAELWQALEIPVIR